MEKIDFLKGVGNWSNHRFLLWPALEATNGDVIELGMGDGSTPFLNEYCKANNRRLFSYDNNLSWVNKFRHLESHDHIIQWIIDWDLISENHKTASVILVDHSPGERRKIDLSRLFNTSQIIVAHDTEINADHGYQMRSVLKEFKFMKDYETDGAWASAVSNTIDVTKF